MAHVSAVRVGIGGGALAVGVLAAWLLIPTRPTTRLVKQRPCRSVPRSDRLTTPTSLEERFYA
jgi:hypothetical protein